MVSLLLLDGGNFICTLTTSFFHGTALSVLSLSQLPGLLNSVCHHLLLFKPLANVVAIKFQIALLAETEQNLRAEAAADH